MRSVAAVLGLCLLVPGVLAASANLLAMHEQPGHGSSDLWWVDGRVLEELRPR